MDTKTDQEWFYLFDEIALLESFIYTHGDSVTRTDRQRMKSTLRFVRSLPYLLSVEDEHRILTSDEFADFMRSISFTEPREAEIFDFPLDSNNDGK